jgi:hypothetical protein
VTDTEVGKRLREAIALSDLMLEFRLQRLREAHPDADDHEVCRLLGKELADRPMDGEGVPGRWPRRAAR